MFSETLWYAFGIYLVGIGIVLYLRPTIMFGPGGIWKEFGLSDDTDNCSLFPFWLFIIVWAILSYAIASMIMIILSGLSMEEVQNDNGIEIFSEVKPVSQTNNFKKTEINTNLQAKSGYYILNTSKNDPSYVFVGNEPPSNEMIQKIINARD